MRRDVAGRNAGRAGYRRFPPSVCAIPGPRAVHDFTVGQPFASLTTGGVPRHGQQTVGRIADDARIPILYRRDARCIEASRLVPAIQSDAGRHTVNGFRFTVDRELSADSWHAYNWVAEHFLAADFIGVTASSKAGFSFAPTFPLYQKHAVAMIKHALDDGIGAVFWKDDFVIAAGYDDEAAVLLYDDGTDPEGALKRLPYGEFGRNATPYWYYQTLEAQLAVDELEIYRESFMQAIYK